jgi:hypothetical protein
MVTIEPHRNLPFIQITEEAFEGEVGDEVPNFMDKPRQIWIKAYSELEVGFHSHHMNVLL